MYDSVMGKMDSIDCIKVNADYESVLFHGRPAPVANRALEFLAFYLQDLPVLTDVSYDQNYLLKVEELTGRKPHTVKKGHALNWWGPLTDLERERWLNSKITSTELSIAEGWTEAKIVTKAEAQKIRSEKEMIIKDPFGMSGRGLVTNSPDKEIHLPKALPEILIVEPKLNRKYDFSHFIFPDGRMIRYENIVDEKFQYRGTIIDKTLSFSSLVAESEWKKFETALKRIRDFYSNVQPYGYSVDSFVYEEKGELKIYPLCEINARRTMGSLAYEFSNILGKERKSALSLKQPVFSNATKLSPEGSFFDIYFSCE